MHQIDLYVAGTWCFWLPPSLTVMGGCFRRHRYVDRYMSVNNFLAPI